MVLPQIAAGLSIASAAKGLFGGKPQTLSSQAQAALQGSVAHITLYKSLEGKIRAADKYGLHRLAAIGAPTAGGGSFTGSIDNSDDLGRLGQAVDRAANVTKNGIQRKLDDLAIEKAEAEIDYIKSQTAGSLNAIRNSGAVPPLHHGLPSDGGVTPGSITDHLKTLKFNKVGLEDGAKPLHKIVVDQAGKPIRVLNTDEVGDNEVIMLQDYLMNTMPDQIKGWFQRSFKDKYWKPKPYHRRR